MKKSSAFVLILVVLSTVAFGTWQLFRGNFEAAFSSLPFLLAVYFFVKLTRP
jgi:hypothetical protein